MKNKKTISQKVTSYESACKLLKVNPKTLPVVDKLDKVEQKRILAYHKLTIIAKALNEGWKLNWNNKDEYKYYPYFYYEGNAFCYCVSYFIGCYCSVGSALVYKNSELAKYAGIKFKKLYNDYMK